MPDQDPQTEHRLLRSIARRRVAIGLLVLIPLLFAGFRATDWLARREHIRPEILQGALLLVLTGWTFVAPRLGPGPLADRRETPRLRWLMRERFEARQRRLRWGIVFGLTLLLASQLGLLLSRHGTPAPISGLSLVSWTAGFATTLRWTPDPDDDECARARTLLAVNRAFLVLMLGVLVALLLDDWRPGSLRPVLSCVILLAALTQQLSLLRSEPRLPPEDA